MTPPGRPELAINLSELLHPPLKKLHPSVHHTSFLAKHKVPTGELARIEERADHLIQGTEAKGPVFQRGQAVSVRVRG